MLFERQRMPLQEFDHLPCYFRRDSAECAKVPEPLEPFARVPGTECKQRTRGLLAERLRAGGELEQREQQPAFVAVGLPLHSLRSEFTRPFPIALDRRPARGK